MSLEHIRVSKQAREQLIRLKRFTGIEHWNVLCRWAFCRSLAEPSVPPPARIVTDSNVEMSWRVFGGRQHEIYLALLKERCLRRRPRCRRPRRWTTSSASTLHRGIAYLGRGPPDPGRRRRLRRPGGRLNAGVGDRAPQNRPGQGRPVAPVADRDGRRPARLQPIADGLRLRTRRRRCPAAGRGLRLHRLGPSSRTGGRAAHAPPWSISDTSST